MSRLGFYTITVLLLLISGVLGYFVVVNTVLADKVLPNVSLGDVDTSLMTEDEIEQVILSEIRSQLPQFLSVSIAGFDYSVPITELVPSVDTSQDLLGYGKGPDIVKVITDAIELVDGEIIATDIQVNPYPVISHLPLNIRSMNPARVVNNEVQGCDTGEYNFEIDYTLLAERVKSAIKNNLNLRLSLADLAKDPSQVEIVDYCNQYNQEIQSLAPELLPIGINAREELVFTLSELTGPSWGIKNYDILREKLINLKANTYEDSDDGRYEFIDGKIALFSPYTVGKTLNIVSTIQSISELLRNPENQLELVYDDIQPSLFNYGYEILDFTKLLGSGRSRIDQIRSGSVNWMVKNAQAGVEEMHNEIVYPGEEFSMYEALDPQPGGWTDEGRPIGLGTCNSATTLFRAALEAGLKITEHSPHAAYYSSYDWPYPDLVDAAYLTEPTVDVKFINDTNYPIILRAEITQKDGWQYHTINVFIGSQTPDREVELTNFQRWNIISAYAYDSSFERIVKENGRIVHHDTYKASYR